MANQTDDEDSGGSSPHSSESRVSEDASALLRAFSHDLAAPLANIKLAAEVLVSAEGRVSESRLAGLGGNISVEAERLRHMVDTLVEWNRLHIGDRELCLEWHLIEDLIGAALRRMEPLLDDQKVVVTIEPDMALVHGDEVLLETALAHLVDNAASNTPGDQSIEILARAEHDACSIQVIDAGPRLENEEDMPRDARWKASRGQAGAPGSGLGLEVSRMIVEAHGGEIWARNRNDEFGAVFAFDLGYGGQSPPDTPIDIPLGDDGND